MFVYISTIVSPKSPLPGYMRSLLGGAVQEESTLNTLAQHATMRTARAPALHCFRLGPVLEDLESVPTASFAPTFLFLQFVVTEIECFPHL